MYYGSLIFFQRTSPLHSSYGHLFVREQFCVLLFFKKKGYLFDLHLGRCILHSAVKQYYWKQGV